MLKVNVSGPTAITMLDAARKGFETYVKERIEKQIVAETLDRVEKDLREMLKKEMESLTLKSFENWQDAGIFGEAMNVVVRWNDA